jgi:hypothetical protein
LLFGGWFLNPYAVKQSAQILNLQMAKQRLFGVNQERSVQFLQLDVEAVMIQ